MDIPLAPDAPGEDHYQRISMADWQSEFGHDLISPVGDPDFIDIDTGDFSLSSDSPALALGFRPIDVKNIGIRKAWEACAVCDPMAATELPNDPVVI